MKSKETDGFKVTFPKVYRISVSAKQIMRVLIIIGLAFLAFRLVDTILSVFIAFIIMAASKPAATFLSKRLKVPEGAAIGIVFISVIVFVSLALYLISRPLAVEVSKFIESLPVLTDNMVNWIYNLPLVHNYYDVNQIRQFFTDLFSGLADQLNNIVNALGSILINAFQGMLSTLFVIVFSIYLYLEREVIKAYIIRAFQFKEAKFYAIYDRVETQLGAWVRGQLILGIVVGLATYIGLALMGVSYALPLAILAGILEIIPVIGPIITGFILTVIGLAISPVIGILSLALSIAIQQLENNFLVPVIMKRAVGLSPVVTMISILIGQELFGILGAIVAVPTAAMLTVIVNTYLDDRDNKLLLKQSSK